MARAAGCWFSELCVWTCVCCVLVGLSCATSASNMAADTWQYRGGISSSKINCRMKTAPVADRSPRWRALPGPSACKHHVFAARSTSMRPPRLPSAKCHMLPRRKLMPTRVTHHCSSAVAQDVKIGANLHSAAIVRCFPGDFCSPNCQVAIWARRHVAATPRGHGQAPSRVQK